MSYRLWSVRGFSFGLLLLTVSSCSNYERPPESVSVETPESVSSKQKPGSYCVFILVKSDTSIWVKYDSSINEQNYIHVAPPLTENLRKALDSLEQQYHLDMSKMPESVMVRGDMALGKRESFRNLKEAFKQKGIYKFKIVTTSDY